MCIWPSRSYRTQSSPSAERQTAAKLPMSYSPTAHNSTLQLHACTAHVRRLFCGDSITGFPAKCCCCCCWCTAAAAASNCCPLPSTTGSTWYDRELMTCDAHVPCYRRPVTVRVCVRRLLRGVYLLQFLQPLGGDRGRQHVYYLCKMHWTLVDSKSIPVRKHKVLCSCSCTGPTR